MKTIFWICFIMMPICYAYLAIFSVRDTIIDKLIRLYIYTDPDFANKSKYTRGDWDSLNYSKFIRKAPIIFALFKDGGLIFTLPFMASLFTVFLFGTIPAVTLHESQLNVQMMFETIGCYYSLAILTYIYHRLSFKRYKEKAVMEKNLWEAKSILAKR